MNSLDCLGWLSELASFLKINIFSNFIFYLLPKVYFLQYHKIMQVDE